MLSEYATLRAEIIARTGYGFQTLAVFIGGLTWLLQQEFGDWAWWYWVIMIVFVVVFFIIAIFVNVRDLSRAANRVAEIEHEVNSRAGEHLLIWESLGGVVKQMGVLRSFVSNVKTMPRSKLPPLDPTYLEREDDCKKKSSKSN